MGKQNKNDIKELKSKHQKLMDENDRLKSLVDKRTEALLVQSDSIKKLMKEIESLKDDNLKLSDLVSEVQKPTKETVTKKSQNIAGWTVTKDQDGYFRARRFINGKTRCVYVGKRIKKETKPKLQKRDREIRSETPAL